MLGLIFEHPIWLAPLFEALEQRGIPFQKIDVSRHAYDMHSATDVLPLYVNRLSASSYQRQHQGAVAFTLSYLKFLEARGARILNGRHAHLEVNKVDQLLAFQRYGLATPRTWIFNSLEQLETLPEAFPFPLLIKPAQGGAGSLIVRFDSRDELRHGAATIVPPPDQLMLAQAYIPPAERFINRVEVLGGNLLYALKVYPQESFNLCPADACDVDAGEQTSRAQFTLNDELAPDVRDDILRLFRDLDLDYGSIEFLTDDQGQHYFYDLNLNSNYRTQLPGVTNFDPWGKFADYLHEQLVNSNSVRAPIT